jgi:hypothetical protein
MVCTRLQGSIVCFYVLHVTRRCDRRSIAPFCIVFYSASIKHPLTHSNSDPVAELRDSGTILGYESLLYQIAELTHEAYFNSLEIKSSEVFIYLHTYHLYFISEGVVEASQIFLRDVLPKLLSYDKHFKRDRC